MSLINLLSSPKDLSAGGDIGHKVAVMVDRLSFEFVYSGLSADTTLTPYVSIDGVNFTEYPAGRTVLMAADTMESVTFLGLSPNMFVKWGVKTAEKPTAGTLSILKVIR